MNLKALRIEHINSINMLKNSNQATTASQSLSPSIAKKQMIQQQRPQLSSSSSLSRIPQLVGSSKNAADIFVPQPKRGAAKSAATNIRKSFLPVRINAVMTSSQSPSSLSSFSPSSSSSSNQFDYNQSHHHFHHLHHHHHHSAIKLQVIFCIFRSTYNYVKNI